MNKYAAAKKLFSPGLLQNSARFASDTTSKPLPLSVKGLPERIYNFPVDQEIMKGWRIQTPQDDARDGMAMHEWGLSCKRPKVFFVFYMIFLALGLWYPFIGLEINLRRVNAQK